MNKFTLLLLFVGVFFAAAVYGYHPDMNKYTVVWNTPSVDATGQMPFGNGDIGGGAYVIGNDALYILLSKNDAFTYNGDIFKTGCVRVSINPNPFVDGIPFNQVMNMGTGSVDISAGGNNIKIWADANKNVYHIQVKSSGKVTVKASPVFWKRIDGCVSNKTDAPLANPTQDVRIEDNGNLIWYFAVGNRSVFSNDLKFYGVPQMAKFYPDPYKYNIFGNLLKSYDLKLKDGVLAGSGKKFDIQIYSLDRQTPKVEEWVDEISLLSEKKLNVGKDWKRHCAWWNSFWDKSWITVSDNTIPNSECDKIDNGGYVNTRKVIDEGAIVAQSYNVFRYLMACQSRGRIMTKFNGGIFTQPLRYIEKPRIYAEQAKDGTWISHPDERLWGRRFTFQNQRLMYWPMIKSGDWDLIQPFFNYYLRMLPVRKAITKAWFGHEGAYYRENIDLTCGERDCGKTGKDDDPETKPLKTLPGRNLGKGYYHSYYFTCGLEMVAMMIDYVKCSGDTAFQNNSLVPFAREILTFFDKHYKRDKNGKIRLDPAQVLETWWIAVNPAPDVSGLQHDLDELISMNVGTEKDKNNWKRFRIEIPEVSIREIDGDTVIAPAEEFSVKHNSENGELYPVFPFKRFGIGRDNCNIAENTMMHRTLKDAFNTKCWSQDQIDWAYCGNAEEAKEGLVRRFKHASSSCRFPLFGDENPDSCPDFDHFGSGSIALQSMVVQEVNGKIYLLPAWPKSWDVDFKLHISGNTIVRGAVCDGKLVNWSVFPQSREKDVVVCGIQ